MQKQAKKKKGLSLTPEKKKLLKVCTTMKLLFAYREGQNSILGYYTVSQKNVPPLVCCDFDTSERILIFLAEVPPIN